MRCYNCFKEFENEYDVCPHCGSVVCDKALEPIHLLPGTILHGRYLLGQAVGSGGFGIIYRAWDLKLETVVAIKEFLSTRLMTRAVGDSVVIVSNKSEQEFIFRRKRFLSEARNMAKFGNHRSIPNVFDFFEENGTAYIVMELLEGIALNTLISQNSEKISREFSIHIINEVGEALKTLHEQGIIHRDVAPDNIYICSDMDLKVKLLDLGAAKLSNSDDTVSDIINKIGYSPIEQYVKGGAIGPWSDVYALGATLYFLLTGVKPIESTSRKKNDELLPPNQIDDTIPENLSNAVMKAMAIDKHMRFKSVDEFLKAINGNKKVLTLEKEKRKRKKHQIIGLSLIAAILLVVGLFLYESYNKMEEDVYLPEATITIWYSAQEGSSEQRAMEYVQNDFVSNPSNANVTVIMQRFDEDKYESALMEAKAKGELPSVFESSGIENEMLEEAIDLDEILNSPQAEACGFLNKYDDYYKDKKKLPLGIETPVAMVITGGLSQIDYSSNQYTDLSSFGNARIAFDSEKKDFLAKSYAITEYDENDFGGENGSAAVLITTTMNIRKYKTDLLEYEWHCAYPDMSANARFVYEWSAAPKQEDEARAAERFLIWLLGNNYQDKLMVSFSQNGELPVNSEQLSNYINNSGDLSGLLDVINNYDFSK